MMKDQIAGFAAIVYLYQTEKNMMNPIQTKPSFLIRQEIVRSIGRDNIRKFELWAFDMSPVKYNRDLLRLWNLHHRSNMHVSENPQQGFSEIINYWND